MTVKHNFLKLFSILAILAILFSNVQPPIARAQSGTDGEGRKVSAAGGDGIKRKINARSGKVSFIGPESGRSVAAAQALGTSIRPQNPALALARRFAPEFGVKDPDRDLVEMKSNSSTDGRLSVRYQQKYQGIPVMGGELMVNTDNHGNLYSMNGEVSPDLTLSTHPAIDSVAAKRTALQEVAKSYEKRAENFIATEPALWIYDESLLKESTRPVELVWRMEVTAKDTAMPVRELVLVNAQSGDVSLHFNQVDTEWNPKLLVQTKKTSLVELDAENLAALQEVVLPLYFDLVIDEVHGQIYGSDSAGNKIDVIDITTLQLVKTFTLVNGASPKGMDLSSDSTELAVAQNGAGSVIFIDLNNDNRNTVIVGGKPFDVIYGKNGRLYSVGSGGTADYIHVIDTTTHAEVAKSSYAIYSNPRLAISSNKNYLYTNMTYTDVIYKFDVTSDALLNPVSTSRDGLWADYFILAPDDSKFITDTGQVWSADLKGQIGMVGDWRGQPAYIPAHNAIATAVDDYGLNDRVVFSSAADLYNLSTYTLPVQGTVGPLVARSDGSELFVSTSKGMLMIDLSSFPPGTATPLPMGSLPYADLVIDESRNVLYGSNTSGNKVDIISLSTQQVIGEIRFNNNTRPMGMDLKPDGQELAVALNGGSGIAFVDPNTRTIKTTVIVDTGSVIVLPFDVKYGRAGRLYSTGNPGSSGPGDVYIIDTNTYTNIGKTNDLSVRSTPYLAISPDNNTIFTIYTDQPNRLCRFDVSTDLIPAKTCGIMYTYNNDFSFILLKDGSKIFTGNGQVWTSSLNAQLGSFNFLGHLVEIAGQNVIAGISKSNPGTILFIRKSDFYTASTYTMPSPGVVGPSTVNAAGTTLFVNTQSGVKVVDLQPISPSSLSIGSGSPQSAHVLADFANPLKVVVRNLLGVPLPGIEVTFTAPAGGASGTFANTHSNVTTAITDANGIATAATFTANDNGGTYSVKASVAGLLSTADFQLTNVPPTILVSSGSPQSRQVLMPFSDPLKVIVQYAPGEPLAGITVTFTAPSSGATGKFSDSNSNTTTAVTDSSGVATASTFTANGVAGSYAVSVTSSGIESSTQFQLTNIPAITCLIKNGTPGATSLLKPYKLYNCNNGNSLGYAVGNGDFNNDGKNDVVLTLGNGNQYKLLVFLQDNNGLLAQPVVYPVGNRPESLAVGDLNHDGRDDVVTSDFSDNKIGVFIQSDNGGLKNRVTYATRTGPGPIAVDDVNHDGMDDIVVVHGNDTVIGVFTQKNDGTLNAMVTYPSVDAGFDDVAIGDVNNDGLNDVVKMNGQGYANPNLMVYLQSNAGTLNPYASYSLSNCSSFCTGNGLAIGDVTGDGRQDVVMSYGGNTNTAKVAVFPQGLDGRLQAAISYSTYDIPGPVEVTDMNSDGLQDVIIAHDVWEQVGLLLQQNNGTLGTTALYPVPYSSYEPQGLSIGDINGDQLKDILLADGEGLVILYRSLGPAAGSSIQTYGANHTTILPGDFLCDNTTTGCTRGANLDADDAQMYADGTYEFYKNQFGRNSINNQGMTIISTVDFAFNYQNAFWNGTQMVYGDGYGFANADDVVAHELTHGVTEYESNLYYYYQSGAINESMSDVFGEYYDQTNGLGNDNHNPGGVKWQLGEDVSGLGALRSMSDPTLYGDPDKMSSLNYFTGGDDNGGVHWNSGVNNKAVYLMVEGDTFNGKTVTGIGWEKVGAIYYEANTNLLTSASDYSDLYYAVQQACANLVGQHNITTADCAQVKNALDAVEMNRRQNFGNLDDPSFEYSYQVPYPYWYQSSTTAGTPLCVTAVCGTSVGTAGPRTGSVWGWFGGTTDYEEASLSQIVYFPGGYPSLKLKFYLWIGRANAGSDANDKFMAQVDGVTVFTANATQKSSYASYRQVSVDVNGFATNALHIITFSSITSGQVVNFNLDDVSLGDNTLQISGNAGVADTLLQYFASGVQKVTADASGNYSIFVPYNWTGTVTPKKTGYTFTPASRSYSNLQVNQTAQDYTAQLCVSCADINVKIGSGSQGDYSLPSGQSMVQTYNGVKGGPVVVKSNNGAPIIASMLELRRSDLTVNQWTGIAQVMGMQLENLSDKYVFPRYTNIDATKYEVIAIANYETFDTNVTVKVGSTIYGPYLVAGGTSFTFNQAIQGGPVLVSSDNGARIVASLYQLKRAGTSGRWNGQSEMMGIPQIKLSDTYVLPYYNYTTPGLLPSLNIANADSIPTDITVSIGAGFSRTYPAVAAGTSRVVSYSGKAGGPVVVKSSNGAKVIASMLELRRSNLTVNQWTGIAQVMGMQLENVSDKYVFPRYTNIDTTKYEVIPIANYETFDTHVTVKVGSTDYGPYLVSAGTSYTFNQAIEGGPVLVSSDNAARIVASLYQLKRAGTTGRWNGQSEMMGIPQIKLSDTYVLPYYDYTTPGLQPSLNIAVP